MQNENFKKYKRIKERLSYNYKGYPVEKILAIDICYWVFTKREFTVKSYLSTIVKHTLPFFVRALNFSELELNEPKKTLFSMGLFERGDYYEMWEDVKKRVAQKISFDFSTQKYQFSFNLKKILLAWSLTRKISELELIARIRLAARITFYLNTIDELEKANPIVGKYCAFSSVHDLETLLTRYFQKRGIKTYSLQHGIYFLQKHEIELSVIAYENFISDFHLCWGQFTKDEFVQYGINKESLIVAGYPRKVTRPKIPGKLNKRNCMVFLASYPFRDANFKLISILAQLDESVNISLKLHPRSQKKNYEEIAAKNNWKLIGAEHTLTSLLKSNKCGWTISVNSSAYYESFIFNIPSLRFNDGSFMDLVDIKKDQFSNLQELKECLNSIPFEDSENRSEYFEDANDKLDYAIGINTDEYPLLNVESKL